MITEVLIAPYATVALNTSTARVPIIRTTSTTFADIAGNSTFLAGDTINLLSTGFIIPGGFSIIQNTDQMTGGIPINILLHGFPHSDLGSVNSYIPFAPYEMSLESFQNPTNNIPFSIRSNQFDPVGFPSLALSMLGVASAWNGVTIEISHFIKIQHNEALS